MKRQTIRPAGTAGDSSQQSVLSLGDGPSSFDTRLLPAAFPVVAVGVASGILLLGALTTGCVLWLAHRAQIIGRSQRPSVSDVGIVLGAYTDGFRPSAALTGRLRAALQLYRSGYVRCLIVSGGRGEDESVSESRSMKRFLVLNGVPPEVILEDRHSRDTWENLRNSRDLMVMHGYYTAVIITSDYHLPRSMAVAKELGLSASGYPARPMNGDYRYAVREVFAFAKYALHGQVRV